MSNKVEAATGGRWNAIAAEARANWSPQAHEIADKLGEQLDAEVAGQPNKFTDAEGDVYTVTKGLYGDDDIITLSVAQDDPDAPKEVVFFKADATKIIALIAEAAK